MKKKDTLDRRLGPTIREIGNRHGLSVTNLKSLRSRSTTAVKDGQMKTWSMERKPSAAICMTGLGLIWSARLV